MLSKIYKQSIKSNTYHLLIIFMYFTITSTLLIHTLKYLTSVKYCFTKRKIQGRV